MTHLPRGVQVLHLDATWLLDLDAMKACWKWWKRDYQDDGWMDEMWIFDDGWCWDVPRTKDPRATKRNLWGEFHGAPVLAGAATPREPCAAELRVALRGCAAALCRKLGTARRAEVARLKWHQLDSMFLTVPDCPSLPSFYQTGLSKDTFADFATVVC